MSLAPRYAASIQSEIPQATPPMPPERELWLQVLAVAIHDYRGRLVAMAGTANSETAAEAAQKRAEAWLFSPLYEDDFFTVCRFAGLEPEFVREVAQRDRRIAWSRS